ncbi:Enterocin A Immunity [Alkalibacterium gilvum]|uniref:Enterocin A Immunity n=1 Tax=Alkalibacterium gilvum TaxID=1130080 RepID=A0A1H6SF34_9LACT|nr:bacteriocin immunity protein [Alkalibacterium gilvum]SEI62335.1 Enterocin A Immunity [Alkalibacterium gilvum]
MTEREKREKLMDAMSATYSDPEVKKEQYIHQLIFDLAKQLNKGKDAHAVYFHLSQELRGYALGNNSKMPESLSNLYELAREAISMSWRGIINKIIGKIILNPSGKNKDNVKVIAN